VTKTVSILIPVYNCSQFISTAIESVLAQTFEDWELIIVDDSSTDESYEIALKYSSKFSKIRAFRNSVNLGMLENWNYGISLCKGKYFAKLDADDFWHPRMLEQCVDVLENDRNVAIVFSKYVNVDTQDKVLPETLFELPDFARNQKFSCIPLVKLGSSAMLQFPILRQGLGLIRRDIFNSLGPYRYLLTAETQASTDTEFYFRVGCHFDLYCIDEVLYFYRLHEGSISLKDWNNGIHQRKIYEMKVCITSYYYEQGKLSKAEYEVSIADAKFQYYTFMLHQYRLQKNAAEHLRLLLKMIKNYPRRSIKFYLQRFLSKIGAVSQILSAKS
jgi:glycosyltransferase involved in cell wall biosynthesis